MRISTNRQNLWRPDCCCHIPIHHPAFHYTIISGDSFQLERSRLHKLCSQAGHCSLVPSSVRVTMKRLWHRYPRSSSAPSDSLSKKSVPSMRLVCWCMVVCLHTRGDKPPYVTFPCNCTWFRYLGDHIVYSSLHNGEGVSHSHVDKHKLQISEQIRS